MTSEIMPRPPYPDLWYVNLIDELKDLITETEFTSRWSLIEGYHSLGCRILQENENFERAKIYGQDIVQRIAESLQKRPRTIYYAIQFAREYPDLNLLPEGKDTNWHKIVNKYLTDGTEKRTKKADLAKMIKEIKKLLETEYLKYHQQRVEIGDVSLNAIDDIDEGAIEVSAILDFIRYLQDQVNKITGGV